jgi:serine/threonine protein kinase
MDADNRNNPTTPEQSDSGFLSGGSLYLSANFQDVELVHSSPNGYCNVYRAQRMGKWHTLKCLKREYADKQEYQALLQKEFELGYHLDHPNIAHTLSMEEVEGLGRCIVMEYVEGRTLRKAIEQGLTREQSLDIVQQLCLALNYIHQRQIIHRDLKPENVMLTFNGNHVKLMDFGLSDADEYAILKQPAGTPRYAAPEQLKADGTISPCTDLYALGIIMQELPHLPQSVMRIAKRCCKPQPEKRYQTAAQVEEAIAKRHLPLWRIASVLFLATLMLAALFFYSRKPQHESPTPPISATTGNPEVIEKPEDSLSHQILSEPSLPRITAESNLPPISSELSQQAPTTDFSQETPASSSQNEQIEPVRMASSVSPDVAFYLSQTNIPKEVQHESRFVHLAEYAYSITMHFLKSQSINSNAEGEAFTYVRSEIDKTMGKDKQTADKYNRYLDVLTQIIADNYRKEYVRKSAADNTPNQEVLNYLEKFAQKWVSIDYEITNFGNYGPSTTNDAAILAKMEREVMRVVGTDSPLYSTYLNHARACAQKYMSEQREFWKHSGQWSE